MFAILSIKLFASLFAVLNPMGALPLFLTLTASRPAAERNYIARVTSLTILLVLLGALFCGDFLLEIFGISPGAFRVGGGILILLMSIAMLHARRSGTKSSPEETIEAMHRSEIAVTPLGTPMLAGPGTMSTVILMRENIHSMTDWCTIIAVIFAASLATYLLLRFSTPVMDRLGRTGVNVTIRLMGLVLAARAVEFIASGLKSLFPVLAS